MGVVLETARLRLREFRPEDLGDLAPIVRDAEQMRFYPRTKTLEEAATWIERNMSLYADYGYGFWLVESREEDAFLGYCGIRPLLLGGVCETEIGWHVRKTGWNQGIATEAAAAVRDLAFGRFGQRRLVAAIRPDNLASCRVAEKIGMREEGQIVFDDDPGVAYVSYVIAADEFGETR